ncbi:MAG: elongation factor P-like protein YeiP [Gammaproteobacteria bacterium]|nr:elongation factor P-like protein YeiP [Gammaproteobacteria bacterium]MDH5803019.1 elongation factor P-like protein YeiP [Gammaproteobacteria bacterium]
MKANELKKGMVINIDGNHVMVNQVHVQTASSRSGNTLYKIKGRNVVNGQKFDFAMKGDETVQAVEFIRRPVQMLFSDSEACTFMDQETYEQHVLPLDMIEEEKLYMTDAMEGLFVLIADERVLGVVLPPTVLLQIEDTAPGIKGASAAARTKPATLTTGLVVQVPEYLNAGETIKVNTDTGEYMSRA